MNTRQFLRLLWKDAHGFDPSEPRDDEGKWSSGGENQPAKKKQ